MVITLLQRLRILELGTGGLFEPQRLAEGYHFIGRYLPTDLGQALVLSFCHSI